MRSVCLRAEIPRDEPGPRSGRAAHILTPRVRCDAEVQAARLVIHLALFLNAALVNTSGEVSTIITASQGGTEV